MTPSERTKAWRLANLERYRLLQKMYARKRQERKRIAEGRDAGMFYSKPE